MAQTNLALLARNVAGALPDLNPTEQEVAVALYRLLGRGVPVSLNTVAERVGLPADVVANTMSGWPGGVLQRRAASSWVLGVGAVGDATPIHGRREAALHLVRLGYVVYT